MLRTFIIVAVFAGALGARDRSQLRVTFDESSAKPLNIVGRPFNLNYEGEKNPIFETGPIGEGLVFDGNYFLLAGEGRVTDNCWSDMELCDKGFTLSVWIKPQTPWQSSDGPEYIVSLGDGVDAPFGVKLAILRRTLMPMVLSRQRKTRLECKIPDDYNSDAWMHITMQQKVDAPLLIFFNGNKMDCDGGDLGTVADVTQVTKTQIVVGADQDAESGDFVGLYHGDIDDLRFYHRALGIPKIRDLFREGKDRVAELQQAVEAARTAAEGQ